MKKAALVFLLCFGLNASNTDGQIIDIITGVIKKVIMAIDLAIQKLQNKTIWLQEAQKQLENTMSKLKLDEISEWVEKQRVLYKDYYEELQKVKTIIAYYQRIKAVTDKQLQLVAAYKKAWALFREDKHFTASEIDYMAKVYTGMVDASLKNLDQIIMVISSFSVQMTDAKRLEIINAAADKIDANYSDLQQFNSQNKILSLSRAKDQQDIDVTRALYGLK